MITGGSLGRLETIHTMFASRTGFLTPGSDWRHRHEVGGSVLFDLGIHHFDLWRVLMQSEVEEVSAHYRADDPAVECATVSAAMGNGVLISASFARGLSDRNEVQICGRDGELHLSCYRFDGLRMRRNSEPQGAARDWLHGVRRAVRNLPHAAALWREGGDVIASYRAQWYILSMPSGTIRRLSVHSKRHAAPCASRWRPSNRRLTGNRCESRKLPARSRRSIRLSG